MYIARCDSEILRSDEVYKMELEYKKRFGKYFIQFNYADFHGTEEKCAAQVYVETLRKALQENKPYDIVSHRYDDFDH